MDSAEIQALITAATAAVVALCAAARLSRCTDISCGCCHIRRAVTDTEQNAAGTVELRENP